MGPASAGPRHGGMIMYDIFIYVYMHIDPFVSVACDRATAGGVAKDSANQSSEAEGCECSTERPTSRGAQTVLLLS